VSYRLLDAPGVLVLGQQVRKVSNRFFGVNGASEATQRRAGRVAGSGPRPPAGDPPHHYHFEIFALDKMLEVSAGAERDVVLEAARGHVIAKGELIGTFEQKQKPLK